jgi:hypothetical protein
MLYSILASLSVTDFYDIDYRYGMYVLKLFPLSTDAPDKQTRMLTLSILFGNRPKYRAPA